jgi:predicted esterase
VVIFHGWGGNENEFISNSTVVTEANKRGYILVAPRGLGSDGGDGSRNSWSFSGSTTGLDGDDYNDGVVGDTDAICDAGITPDYTYPSCSTIARNTCSWTHCQADDVAFALDLIGEIKSCLHVNAANVFATGGSNGGMFTWELGQDARSAPVFRAIAPLIGLPHRAYSGGKGKTADMPVLVITGTRDKVVPPGPWDDPLYTTTCNARDKYYYTAATAITHEWAAAHACRNPAKAVSFNDGYREADCRTYCPDDSGWPRVLDCRARMGHSYGLSWSWKLIMDFFDAHSQ